MNSANGFYTKYAKQSRHCAWKVFVHKTHLQIFHTRNNYIFQCIVRVALLYEKRCISFENFILIISFIVLMVLIQWKLLFSQNVTFLVGILCFPFLIILHTLCSKSYADFVESVMGVAYVPVD